MFGRAKKKAWLVAADMGYGHQRAALPLQRIAFQGTLINANSYSNIPDSDQRIWRESRRFYEFVSRFRRFPVLGDFVFAIFDKFQEIKEFYPKEQPIDSPSFQLKQIYGLMEKKQWGKRLIEKLNKNPLGSPGSPLPFVTTFFITALMAEYWKYRGPIWVVVTDTDISRAWAPMWPRETRIRYCVPTQRAAQRLKRYGIPAKNIFCTGFPFPEEFTKNTFFEAKRDLERRLLNLDPKLRYRKRYSGVIKQYLGAAPQKKSKAKPVNVTFAIGGAGAQGEIAEQIMESLAPLLKARKVNLRLISGIHKNLTVSFHKTAKKAGLSSALGKSLFIVSAQNKQEYFSNFFETLRATDILWTKPSELVFYAALGIPLLLAPPIGSQEVMNRKWLLKIGAGVEQMNPTLAHEWLADLVDEGVFAKAAMQGFIEIEKHGTENIIKLITQKKF